MKSPILNRGITKFVIPELYTTQVQTQSTLEMYTKSRSLEKVRLSIQHPIVQTPLIRLIKQQVEILERLSKPERLFRILRTHTN